jgi:hypothetical protein
VNFKAFAWGKAARQILIYGGIERNYGLEFFGW